MHSLQECLTCCCVKSGRSRKFGMPSTMSYMPPKVRLKMRCRQLLNAGRQHPSSPHSPELLLQHSANRVRQPLYVRVLLSQLDARTSRVLLLCPARGICMVSGRFEQSPQTPFTCCALSWGCFMPRANSTHIQGLLRLYGLPCSGIAVPPRQNGLS